ncbi:MAG: N-6 DNA methylase [Mariniphaga sp.]|nr:N-6 DNA methylase [Mariniphaga sp.]
MSLFQKSVEKKYLNDLDSALIDKKYVDFQDYFGNPERQENIRNSKEEQFQEGFLRELFVNILGYTLNPEPNFNLTTELKNISNSKKADGAILKGEDATAVIELKGTNTTDLDKIETQAFGYKNHHPKCKYVITSNFEKLRFYIQNAVDHVDFELFSLSKEQFSLLWLCLAKDSLLADLPLKIKESSVLQEENITKKLYADYSKFREAIYNNLVKNNPETDKLLLFKKTQKLLDRFLFIFFAEDRLLLPPNSITEIVKQWTTLKEELDEYFPLYTRFKKYFGYMNTGFKGKRYDIYAYNGGLFKPDEILDNIIIDDEILHEHTLKLSNYDFETDVDVNILGHIFEHSLGEIENVQAEIKGEKVDNQKTKRKKDGIFYTPKYITKYIVENTVGKLCNEKRNELQIIDEDFAKGRKNRKKDTIKSLIKKLDDYRNWLLTLTILDPACGSGAFLNQALEFLITEHQKIDELRAQLLGGGLVFSDITSDILEKNIYGVDLNEESVEIAKLSLWLRTAQKGRKLNTLSNNIKCGNSLIDDPEIAGDKAFNWQNEFPEIFANGGFDVVIGNPPYVHLEKIKDTSIALKNANYETYHSQGDIYCVFVEKGINILKPNGLISYIMLNKWLQAGYGKPLREYFLKYKMTELIDFGDIQIFDGATTYPCIFVTQKGKPQEKISISVLKESNSIDFKFNVAETAELFETKSFSSETWVITSKKEQAFLEKLKTNFIKLSDFIGGQSYRGVLTGLTEAFLIDEETKQNIINQDSKAEERIHPFLQGRDLTKYNTIIPSSYLLLFEKGFTNENIEKQSETENWLKYNYPSIENWLAPFEDRGKKRTDKGDYWWELRACDYYQEFAKPKIMYQKFQVKPCFIYDEQGLFCNDSMWIIPTENKALLGVLNSKMGWWLITKYCTQIQNGCQLIWKYFGQIPIPELKSSELTVLVEKMLEITQNQQAIISSFIKYLNSQFPIDKLSRKLESWHELEFSEFIKELNKAIKKSEGEKLTKSDEMDWMEVFENKKTEAQTLKSEIEKTDKEIDQMVYELYGLSKDEIKIVEGS